MPVSLFGGWSRNHRCVFHSLLNRVFKKKSSPPLTNYLFLLDIPRTNGRMFCTEPDEQFSSTAPCHFAFSCNGIWPGMRCFKMCFHAFILILLKLQEWEAFVMKLLPFPFRIIESLENEWPIYRTWWSLSENVT